MHCLDWFENTIKIFFLITPFKWNYWVIRHYRFNLAYLYYSAGITKIKVHNIFACNPSHLIKFESNRHEVLDVKVF